MTDPEISEFLGRPSTLHPVKTTFLAFAFAAALFLAGGRAEEPLPPVLGTDSLGLPYRILFQADGGVIAAVHMTGDILSAELTGRWLSSPDERFLDTDKNGFGGERDTKALLASWDALTRRFSESQGKPVPILVFIDHGYHILGGVPTFRFPQDRLQIFNTGKNWFNFPQDSFHSGGGFNFNIGYQF